jgi:hypothetical protein
MIQWHPACVTFPNCWQLSLVFPILDAVVFLNADEYYLHPLFQHLFPGQRWRCYIARLGLEMLGLHAFRGTKWVFEYAGCDGLVRIGTTVLNKVMETAGWAHDVE